MSITYFYLRASTADQDASRARHQLEAFAAEKGLNVGHAFVENASGTKLDRPELFKLLASCVPGRGDILLIEAVDRLTRLSGDDWRELKAEISKRGVRVVSLDLPLTHMLLDGFDDLTARIFEAQTAMMLDVLAAIARKDWETRRQRAAQGVVKAKAAGRFKGRPANVQRNADIRSFLREGRSWGEVQRLAGCSRAQVAKIAAIAKLAQG